MHTLSVIIPVYNTAQYLRECVASVRAYAGVDIILVDDGSDDGVTAALCDAIARERDDVRVIHSENRGLGGARELGLAHAVGDYVIFLDSDDLLAEGAPVSVISAAKKHDFPDVIAFDFLIRTPNGKDTPSRADVYVADRTFTVREHPEHLLSLPSAWSRAWKRTFLASTRISFPSRLRYEDLATVPALTAAADSVCTVGDALCIYRIRDGSIMTDTDPDKNRDIMTAFDLLLSRFDSLGLRDTFKNELCRLAVSHILLAASVRVLSRGGDAAENAAREFHAYVRCRFPDLEQNPYLSRLNVREKILFRLLVRGHMRTAHAVVRAYNALK